MNTLFKNIWFQILISNIVVLWVGIAVADCPDAFSLKEPGKEQSITKQQAGSSPTVEKYKEIDGAVQFAKNNYSNTGMQKSFEENQAIQKYKEELNKLSTEHKDILDDTLIKLYKKLVINSSVSIVIKYPIMDIFIADNKNIFDDMIQKIHEHLIQKQVVFGHLVERYRGQDGSLHFRKDHEPYFNHLLDILYENLSYLKQIKENSIPEHEGKEGLARLISELSNE